MTQDQPIAATTSTDLRLLVAKALMLNEPPFIGCEWDDLGIDEEDRDYYLDAADAVLVALAEWMDHIERRAEESEAYKQGRADGYAEAYRLFGPELESLRERVSENGRSGYATGGVVDVDRLPKWGDSGRSADHCECFTCSSCPHREPHYCNACSPDEYGS